MLVCNFSGLVMKLPIWDEPQTEKFFDDDVNWHIPEEGYPAAEVDGGNGEFRPETRVNVDAADPK